MPIIQGLIWAIGLTFLLDNVGLHVSTIIAGLGIVGVAVGLAGQAILSDFFSYIVILLDKPFQVGDFLELSDGKSGSVEYIGPKTTRLLSLDGDTIVCANASLTRGILVNMGNIREREVILEIGVAYATPMPVVRKLPEYLMEVVNSFPQCRYERACMLKFGSANYLFQLIYKVSPQPGGLNAFMDAQSNVNLAIQEMLNNRKIAGAYPTETILLNNVTPPPTPPEHKQEKQEQALCAFVVLRLLRLGFGFRLGFFLCPGAGITVVKAYGAAFVDCPGFAFLLAGAGLWHDGCFLFLPVLNQCHKVGFVHHVKEMHGVFPLGGTVYEDIKIIAVLGGYCDELLVLSPNIINKGCVPLRGQRVAWGRCFLRLWCGRGFFRFVFLPAACVGGHGKAARKDKGGGKCK